MHAIFNIYIFNFTCMYVCTTSMQCLQKPERVPDLLELELEDAGAVLWVLGKLCKGSKCP